MKVCFAVGDGESRGRELYGRLALVPVFRFVAKTKR